MTSGGAEGGDLGRGLIWPGAARSSAVAGRWVASRRVFRVVERWGNRILSFAIAAEIE